MPLNEDVLYLTRFVFKQNLCRNVVQLKTYKNYVKTQTKSNLYRHVCKYKNVRN
ncbi:hypothetical protein HanPSC8_Chr10g0443111 [Helianthus annuus]|nr:hypothetical protein HanPSC8_Chr10g0443111 [Helianthus annuus]